MRWRALPIVIVIASAGLAARQVPVHQAVELYARGDMRLRVAAINTRELRVDTFTEQLEPWIGADSASAGERTLVAAAFALEVVWAATRRADDKSNVGWSIVLEPHTRTRMGGPSSTGLHAV